MPAGKTAIEFKSKSYENLATPSDWPENKNLTDIYLDDAATSEDLGAFLSSNHIYTDKYGTRYFGDIAVPSMLTHFIDAANDPTPAGTSDDMEHLVINPGQTSLYDRIMNLIADAQPERALSLIDNALQHMTERNQEKTLSAIVDFWNAMTDNGFKAEADHLSGTLAIWDKKPEDENEANKEKFAKIFKPDKRDEFQPIVIGGLIARTKEEEEMFRLRFAMIDAQRNGPR
jgi:hypothetical protein